MKRTIDLIPFAVGGAIAAALLLASAARCFGQDYDARAVVSVGQQDLSNPAGSFQVVGTIISTDNNRAVVVTVAHAFEGPDSPRWVQWNGGQRVPATLVGVDHQLDVAAVVASNPPDVTPIAIAGEGEYPQAGDRVHFLGHGGGNWRHFEVNVKGYTSRRESAGYNTQLCTDLRPIPGDSGGPIIYRGKLVGIQWGGPSTKQQPTVATESHATYSGEITRLLTQWRVCPNGQCPQPPMRPVPQRPVPSRPQPPPPGPSVPPSGGAAGCQCKGTNACKCDPKAKACACDLSELVSLKKEIADLKVLIASGSLKGEKGDPGKDGSPGTNGKDAEGKSCNCKEPTGESAAPAPVYFDIKPRKRK